MKPVKSLDWQWYGTGAAIVDIADSVTEYAINCDTPNGRMKVFHLFPGISKIRYKFNDDERLF